MPESVSTTSLAKLVEPQYITLTVNIELLKVKCIGDNLDIWIQIQVLAPV